MNANNFNLNESSASNYTQQANSLHPYQNQMQPPGGPIPTSENETYFYFQQRQFNPSQGNSENFLDDSVKMYNTNEPNGKFASNVFIQENETALQRSQQQMAVSSPSVSSTADLNTGLVNGQNGMRFGSVCGGAQQFDSTGFNAQRATVDEEIVNGDISMSTHHSQQNSLRQPLQFCAMNGQVLNGHNGGMCFPLNLPPPAMVPSPGTMPRRTFLFNSEMANHAVKSMQQHLAEDMAVWHMKHCAVVPSTSRAIFEQKVTVNSNNNCANSPAPRASNSRGTKRKASAAQSVADIQQPHSMSLSPRDIRPPSYSSSIGHPQSAPVMSNQFDQPQQPNELCDSSTNSDNDMFRGSSGHLQANLTMSTYIQNSSFGQMEENPLKKMEIMTSKTLNEPTNGRIQRLCSEEGVEQSQPMIVGAADTIKQEKMHKLQEIEKALLPFADNGPTYPNAVPFPDSTQFRPHFFAPIGQMMPTPHAHFGPVRPLNSFPQNHAVKMAMMNSNQMYGPIGDRTVMQSGAPMMTTTENLESQQTWIPQ